MKKILFSFILILLISSCVLKTSIEKPSISFSLGLRPLPEEFLNWWFENLDELKNSKKLVNFYDDIANTQEIIYSPVIDVTGITSYDMRDLGLVTPPKNQGGNYTCWAFATVGSLESAMLTQLGPYEISQRFPFIPDPYNPDLSEQFLAYYNFDWKATPRRDWWNDSPSNGWVLTYHETNKDLGGNAFFSMFQLIRKGVPIEEDFPYIKEDYDWIAWNPANDNWKIHRVRSNKTFVIKPYYYSYDYDHYINTIKSVLMEYGALFVTFKVYSDFYDYWSWWPYNGKVYFKGPDATPRGRHAILLVGWDDYYYDSYSGYYGPVWILKNSWGTDEGDDGYFYLPMITQDEFYGTCPDWKIENEYMYVPCFEN